VRLLCDGGTARLVAFVKAALESLYATEQSRVSLIPLDKLTSYVTSVVSTFSKRRWFQKRSGTTVTAA